MRLLAKKFIIICSLLISFYNTLVIAADVDDILTTNSIRLSGFGTLSATSAGNDILGYHREFTSNYQTKDWSLKSDSILGLQADWNISPQLDANLQLVVKDRAKNGLKESIEWANLKYRINDNLEVRAGRMGVDIYMLSEYRNVGYAYLWARPVEEFYKPLIFTSFDGIDIAYTQRLKRGNLQFKLFAGESSANLSTSDGYRTIDLSDFAGVNVSFQDQAWKFRLGASTGIVSMQDDPIPSLRPLLNSLPSSSWPDINSINDTLKHFDKRISYYSAGFSYETDWQLQSEIAYLDSEFGYFPASYSAYISIGKRFNQITPYVVVSKIMMKDDAYQVGAPNPNPFLEAIQPELQGIIDKQQLDQQSISLGFRWDFRPKMALKAQWTHTEINDHKSAFWAQFESSNDVSRMDTFSINLDFVF